MTDQHEHEGLRSADAAGIEAFGSPRRWSKRRIVLQSLGLLLGLALLAWAVSLSMSEGNRRSIEAMRDAPASEVVLLIGLTVASLVLNGLMFWITLRPVHRLRAVDVVMVNCISTFLSILPFKLSLVARVLIHHRRDGVRFKVLIPWVIAMGALGLAVLLPFVGATMLIGRMNAAWWAVALGGVLAFNLAGVWCGRMADRWVILHRLGMGSDLIVRHASAVAGHGALRLADTAVLAGRFLAAAAIANQSMPVEQAVLLATTYFLLSVITPAGTLGFREAGTAALGMTQGLAGDQVALIALVVTGAEVIASGALASIAFFWIRPDRLLLSRELPQKQG